MTQSTESISESRSAAERLMNPDVTVQEVLDDNQDARELFTLPTGDQLIFRGRDDAYLPPIQTDKIPTLLTVDEAAHTTAKDETHTESAPAAQGENLYIVNATPVGVIDLALRLKEPGARTDELDELRNNLINRQFGQKENALLDLMAASVYEPESYAQPGAPHLGGLVDVAQALNGDEKKTASLHERLVGLERVEHGLAVTELGTLALDKLLSQEKTVSPEAVELAKGIMLVRATSFEPEMHSDGSVALQSASDYTHYIQHSGEGYAFVPRETIHFSLNHAVESHMGGDFTGKMYTIISPLDKALEANGAPARFADVDTYFATGPNEKITLPESIVISPDSTQSEIVRREANRIFFKDKGFTEADAARIVTAYARDDFSEKSDREEPANEYFVDQKLKDKLLRFAESQAMFVDESDSSITKYAVDQGIIPDWRLAPPLDRDSAKNMDFAELATYIASRQHNEGTPVGYDLPLGSLVSALTVDGAIVDQGGSVVEGGMHYTSSNELQATVRKISDMLQVQGGLHSNTAEESSEKTAMEQLYGSGGKNGYDVNVNQSLSRSDVPHNVRRSYIANGLLVAHGKPELAENNLFMTTSF